MVIPVPVPRRKDLESRDVSNREQGGVLILPSVRCLVSEVEGPLADSLIAPSGDSDGTPFRTVPYRTQINGSIVSSNL